MNYKKPNPRNSRSKSFDSKTSSDKTSDRHSEKQSGLDYNLVNMSIDQVREELIIMLKDRSLFEADSVLPSGRITGDYLDLKESLLSARGAYLSSMAILHHLKDEVEAIGGFIDKTYSLAASVSQLAFLRGQEIDSFFVRDSARTFGHSRWIEGPLKPGSKVCVIQDQIISGATVIETIRKLQEEADAQIVQVISVVDRQDGARYRLQEYGVDFTAIVTMDDILDYAPAFS